MGLGVVFTGVSIGDNPEDDEKLKKLEKRLVELKFVTTPKLEVLCSCSFLPHMEEPVEKAVLPPADAAGRRGSRIVELTWYWKPGGEHDRQRRNRRNAQREEAKMR
jgi:hypothetical protein